jgi:hypothetical protein
MPPSPDRRGLPRALAKDGRPLIVLTALALLFSGGFALFLSVGRQFLPHDLAFLKFTEAIAIFIDKPDQAAHDHAAARARDRGGAQIDGRGRSFT